MRDRPRAFDVWGVPGRSVVKCIEGGDCRREGALWIKDEGHGSSNKEGDPRAEVGSADLIHSTLFLDSGCLP